MKMQAQQQSLKTGLEKRFKKWQKKCMRWDDEQRNHLKNPELKIKDFLGTFISQTSKRHEEMRKKKQEMMSELNSDQK